MILKVFPYWRMRLRLLFMVYVLPTGLFWWLPNGAVSRNLPLHIPVVSLCKKLPCCPIMWILMNGRRCITNAGLPKHTRMKCYKSCKTDQTPIILPIPIGLRKCFVQQPCTNTICLWTVVVKRYITWFPLSISSRMVSCVKRPINVLISVPIWMHNWVL